MEHEPVIVSTIAIGLTAAFIGGLIARRLRLPTIVGYLVAGVAVGPFTPGLRADPTVAGQLAEIGVILLMFGVGVHFSLNDLLSVRAVAVPGALGKTFVATLLGVLLGLAMGWSLGGAIVLGFAVSVASTVVLLRALGDRRELESPQGRVAVGWVVVEDIFTVVVLVLLPTIAPLLGGSSAGAGTLGPAAELVIALAKAAVFAALMFVVGARFVPWLLTQVAREGSRELFTLAVLAVAVGLAVVASVVFGVSFALGAFLAGAIVAESDLSHQVAADALPLRDAFAVLFFVSVGMLLDPAYLVQQPLTIVALLAVVVLAKAVLAFVFVTILGQPIRTALTVGAGNAQIGEFSFVVATAGLSLGLLPAGGLDLIVAGAIFSITLNPLLFRAVDPLGAWLRRSGLAAAVLERRAHPLSRPPAVEAAGLRAHAIICGYGRVGRMIGSALERRGFRYAVISEDRRAVEELRARGVLAFYGDASNPELLELAGAREARLLIVAIGDVQATRLIVERGREANPRIEMVVRTHSDREATRLRGAGSTVQTVHGERELAVQMARYSLRRFGVSAVEAEAIAQGLRSRGGGEVIEPSARGGGGDWLGRMRFGRRHGSIGATETEPRPEAAARLGPEEASPEP
ncbi:MAG TPA: cation:proton antiporter [Candidatus Dormibacteraeota bacterium]|nr:cation:proton antiporter [Candidatus Dormibacteraeota bacterium]